MLLFVHMVKPNIEVNGTKVPFALDELVDLEKHFKSHGIEYDPGDKFNLWACTMFQNSIVWQLGDQQHCGARNTRLTDEEVLTQAKKTILDAEFVGFYETLDVDFWHLKQTIFKDVSLPYFVPWAFWFGTQISKPRLTSLKYSSQLTASQLAIIKERAALDIKLWEWARARYRPDLVLYPDYTAWMHAHRFDVLKAACLALASLVCLCGCFCLALRSCCKLCCWFFVRFQRGLDDQSMTSNTC